MSSAMRSCSWMAMCETCTYLCCLYFPLSVRVLSGVSSFCLLHRDSVFFKKKNILLLESWSYSSTLAYLVDANNGRSSTTVATNSAFRGIYSFIATETVVPLQVCPEFLYYQISIHNSHCIIFYLGWCRRWYVFST